MDEDEQDNTTFTVTRDKWGVINVTHSEGRVEIDVDGRHGNYEAKHFGATDNFRYSEYYETSGEALIGVIENLSF